MKDIKESISDRFSIPFSHWLPKKHTTAYVDEHEHVVPDNSSVFRWHQGQDICVAFFTYLGAKRFDLTCLVKSRLEAQIASYASKAPCVFLQVEYEISRKDDFF